MPSPSINCDLLIPRFGCGWWHRKFKKRKSCTLLLEERMCPILKHRTDEEWAHVPGEIRDAVLAGTYPAEILLRWEAIFDDLMNFVLRTVDNRYGGRPTTNAYQSHHAALGILRKEYMDYEGLVFSMEDSAPRAITGPTKDEEASAILDLRDVAAVALMAQFHLTRHMEGGD